MTTDELSNALAASDATTATRAVTLATYLLPGSTLRELAAVCGLTREWSSISARGAVARGWLTRTRNDHERGHRYYPV
jgi:DNA-binding MarR family transcriptional regulator